MSRPAQPSPVEDRIWQAPAGPGRAELKVRGSRFLADIRPAEHENDAARHLQALREEFPRATHHCWAWRLWLNGEVRERSGDDGEPSGTAGQPILRALQSADVESAHCVVVRWFGGTKLGAGPLARAYRDTATAACQASGVTRRRHLQLLRLSFPHDCSTDVRRGLTRLGCRILKENHGAEAGLTIGITLDRAHQVAGAVADASRGGGQVADEGLTTVEVKP